MFDHVKKSKEQGNLGVTRAIYEYSKLGYHVSIPMGDCQKYDLIIDDGTCLKKVQVKTSRKKDGISYMVSLESNGWKNGKYTHNPIDTARFDILFVLVEDGSCWSIPADKIITTTAINVGGEKYQEYLLNT